MILRTLFCVGLCLVTSVHNHAAETAAKEEEPVLLGAFVVTANTRGIIPLNGYFRFNLISRNSSTPVIITNPMHPSHTLESYGLEKDEQIIAVNGQRIVGLDRTSIVRLWMEGGDAGDPVELTIRGTGENASVFRKVVLKRIAPPKPAEKSK